MLESTTWGRVAPHSRYCCLMPFRGSKHSDFKTHVLKFRACSGVRIGEHSAFVLYSLILHVRRRYFSTPPDIVKLCHIVKRLLVGAEADETALALVAGPVADFGSE